ncbi:hypothetical protein [Cohaesibacter haloalkalitolerans]|uniref:hypothetical protein n=1 Tax=Cohaesibacter haloalkalitolerans TaxID=1162980 RepID=UPI000E659D5B|nr:hypothetical protein [Cohaesibacter haloalkalitolerans]
MKNTYSLEFAASKIDNSHTKENFQEVLSSYHTGNYRSAAVMLWSVVICDLIYKLRSLEEQHSDTVAKRILEDMEAIQTREPKSSAWEIKLIDDVTKKTELLNAIEHRNFANLQAERHLSAHPVISDGAVLHRPNQETTRALIRNALDDLLLKPPLFATSVVNKLLDDLAENKEIFPGDADLKRYLNSKYFNKIEGIRYEQALKGLWKIVFNLENEKCDENRDINYRSLKILVSNDPNKALVCLNSATEHFSALSTNQDILILLIELLSGLPSLYEPLEPHAKVAIERTCEENSDAFLLSSFLSEDPDEHYEKVKQKVEEGFGYSRPTSSSWNRLTELYDAPEWKEKIDNLKITFFGDSGSYDTADIRFTSLIAPIISRLSQPQLVTILEKINGNSQIYDRRRAQIDNQKVMDRVKELDEHFDFSIYKNL